MKHHDHVHWQTLGILVLSCDALLHLSSRGFRPNLPLMTYPHSETHQRQPPPWQHAIAWPSLALLLAILALLRIWHWAGNYKQVAWAVPTAEKLDCTIFSTYQVPEPPSSRCTMERRASTHLIHSKHKQGMAHMPQ